MPSEVGGASAVSPMNPSLLKMYDTPSVALYPELRKMHELDTFITPVMWK